MTNHSLGFLFVHGAWHDRHTWDLILPLLHAQGYVAEALDLPGAGVNAKNPVSYDQRPLDPVAFANEPSPNVDITQAQFNVAISNKVVSMAARTNGKVVLVGHSKGGLAISAVTEMGFEQIAAVVYISGILVSNGVSALTYGQDPNMAQGEYSDLLMADPAVVGAARIDWQSTDFAYSSRLKAVFYDDVHEDTYQLFKAHLHPDEPMDGVLQPSPITPVRFGTVPRHYIRTSADRVFPPAAQDYMIARVDATMPTTTIVHKIDSSHSPFASQPIALVDILINIATQS
ncbi:alpha/beta fold hydrolase [Rhodocytophaga aerolata]|uniref:Alpha/beta fold hydrolase n=1 Tax=Rhodocytophaga aerolata TaxID=455078 RepID=A0ABT8RCX8_9BACT|nr:alpha/beta fold hydrolase [Rhodocytophaga aerolata]MDO1449945.1 alpha/beta fold hydrolase [Rhodocytophaga aerolata]